MQNHVSIPPAQSPHNLYIGITIPETSNWTQPFKEANNHQSRKHIQQPVNQWAAVTQEDMAVPHPWTYTLWISNVATGIPCKWRFGRENIGKSCTHVEFSIAMFDYQRVVTLKDPKAVNGEHSISCAKSLAMGWVQLRQNSMALTLATSIPMEDWKSGQDQLPSGSISLMDLQPTKVSAPHFQWISNEPSDQSWLQKAARIYPMASPFHVARPDFGQATAHMMMFAAPNLLARWPQRT